MGSYAITLTTSADTDALLPTYVVQYNLIHGTTFTTAQYAAKVASDAIDQKTKALLLIMGQ